MTRKLLTVDEFRASAKTGAFGVAKEDTADSAVVPKAPSAAALTPPMSKSRRDCGFVIIKRPRVPSEKPTLRIRHCNNRSSGAEPAHHWIDRGYHERC